MSLSNIFEPQPLAWERLLAGCALNGADLAEISRPRQEPRNAPFREIGRRSIEGRLRSLGWRLVPVPLLLSYGQAGHELSWQRCAEWIAIPPEGAGRAVSFGSRRAALGWAKTAAAKPPSQPLQSAGNSRIGGATEEVHRQAMEVGQKKTKARQASVKKSMPAAVPISSSGPSAIAITGEDLKRLSKDVGMALKEEVCFEDIASELSNAISLYVRNEHILKEIPAPSELNAWFQSVERSASDLLKTLVDTTPLEVLKTPQRFSTSRQNLLSEFFHSDLYLHGIKLPPEVLRLIDKEALKAELSQQSDGMPKPDPMKVMRRLAFVALLDSTPWLIALIAELGHEGAKKHAEKMHQKTNTMDKNRRELFLNLCGIHHKITGRAPRVRSGERRDGGLPAVKWTMAIFQAALERAPGAVGLSDLVTISPKTIASYLEEGITGLRASKS